MLILLNLLLKKYEDQLLVNAIQQLNSESKSFGFLNEDEDDAWYQNTFNGTTQWEVPTQPASFGYETISSSNGSSIWYKPLEGRNGWYEMRNASGMWYENPSTHGNGVRFNTPQ